MKAFWIILWLFGYILEGLFWALVVLAPVAVWLLFAVSVVIIKIGFLS